MAAIATDSASTSRRSPEIPSLTHTAGTSTSTSTPMPASPRTASPGLVELVNATEKDVNVEQVVDELVEEAGEDPTVSSEFSSAIVAILWVLVPAELWKGFGQPLALTGDDCRYCYALVGYAAASPGGQIPSRSFVLPFASCSSVPWLIVLGSRPRLPPHFPSRQINNLRQDHW